MASPIIFPIIAYHLCLGGVDLLGINRTRLSQLQLYPFPSLISAIESQNFVR